MGKASENERIKLRATYLNNIAVGLIVGGGFLPLFVLMQHTDSIIAVIEGQHVSISSYAAALSPVFVCVLAMFFGQDFRLRALNTLNELQD